MEERATSQDGDEPGSGPEPEKERIDRELIELLNELRVALPGVQVLFAFLLILPFQQSFDEISREDRFVYLLALAACAAATAMLIAPSMYHRLNFRRKNKLQMLLDSNRLLIVGSLLTAAGIAASIYLIVDIVVGGVAAVAATAVTLLLYAALWIVLPLLRRGPLDP